MPHILYPEWQEKPKFFINPYKMDATKQWLKHYSNWLLLQRIYAEPKDWPEKAQANKEILKAQEKLAYWEKMPNFNIEAAYKEKKVLLEQWKISEPRFHVREINSRNPNNPF